jgi:tetratricopeptide (TPR) repeat protein
MRASGFWRRLPEYDTLRHRGTEERVSGIRLTASLPRCVVSSEVVAIVLVVVTALSIACGPSNESGTKSNRPALRAVTLPDISKASETVQAQIRDRYATLTKTIDDPRATGDALAAAYGEMGKLFIASEYLDAAEACFVNARTLAPSDMRWPYYLAHVFRFKDDTRQAAASFEQALALQPDHVPSLVWLAEIDLTQSRPEAAEPRLVKAQSLQPRSATVLYGLGRVALAKQDYAQAVKQLEGALTLAPQASRIHYPLALAYRGLGDRRKADEHLRQRGEVDLPPLDPLMGELANLLQNAAAYETRGADAIDERRWADAVTNLRKASELAPNNAFTRLNLGTSLYMMDDTAGALEQFQAAVRLSPELAKAHFGIGVIMETRGQDREAIDAFAAAVKYDPGLVEARFSLATALRRSGRVRESFSQYDEILRLNPAVSQASFGYAMGLVRLGRYQEARDRLERDVKTFPDQPGLLHALARLLAAAPDDRVRDGSRALMLVEELLKAQRTLGLAETMAMALAELGRFDEAVRWQSDAIDVARKSGSPHLVPRLTQNLRLYEARQPCRTPWPDDDPVHHPRADAK